MRRSLGWLIGLAVAGCGAEAPQDFTGESGGADQENAAEASDIGDVQQPFTYDPDNMWERSEVKVCFVNGAENYIESGWVRAAVEARWERIANIDLSHWGSCDDVSEDISIDVGNFHPNSMVGEKSAAWWV